MAEYALDDIISFLVTNQHYLTDTHIRQLQKICGPAPQAPTSPSYAPPTRTDDSLYAIAREQLERTIELRDSALVAGDEEAAGPWMNTLIRQIAALAKMESEIYNAHRLRQVELATIEILNSLSPELKEKFLSLLEARLQ